MSVSNRPTPPVVPMGARVAGGVVVGSRAADEHVVRLPGGRAILVAVGESSAIEREADALERIGGSGPFPRVVECGVDDVIGSYLALAVPPPDARPVALRAPQLSFAGGLDVVRAMMDAAQIVERLGFAWEPSREDVLLSPEGVLHLARLRVPRRLAPGERLDARAAVEAVGPALVPVPAVEGPPRMIRLLLPHVAMRGDAGSAVEDVRAEIAEIDREAGATEDAAAVAGTCHPGLARAHNEDTFTSAAGDARGEPWAVLVACDGVSSSARAELASTLASQVARDTLAHAMAERAGGRKTRDDRAVAAAIRAAHEAVCERAKEPSASDDPPGTTIVTALVHGSRLTVGWVGDSRAYWVPADPTREAQLLTRDHSWVRDAVASGDLTEEQAMQSPLAHALTRCLGPLEIVDPGDTSGLSRRRVQDVEPDVESLDLRGAGYLVLCTDGFWNYFSAPAEVARLVRSAGQGATAHGISRLLVNHALACGGQDNTTVLVYAHAGL
ncbi:MAG TPA: PP2C family serine/threonine-protein phosphatase [Polyangiaceae bacterium]